MTNPEIRSIVSVQGVLPVGRFPTRDYEEITVTLGKVGRLSLLIIVCLENQGNDSRNDHAELKQFFPCNHNRHPLSHWMGAKKSITPEENRGEPPTGVLLAAPSTAYHKNWQIARKNREHNRKLSHSHENSPKRRGEILSLLIFSCNTPPTLLY